MTKDDGPRAGYHRPEGSAAASRSCRTASVTCRQRCPLNDGAAAVIVMSDTKAKELGLTPLARVVSTAVTGLSPRSWASGPVDATRLALKRAGKTVDDIDLFEINEAFAAQVIPSYKDLGIPLEKLNVHGGAIAVGHPFGMTGARITGTLINGLQTDRRHLRRRDHVRRRRHGHGDGAGAPQLVASRDETKIPSTRVLGIFACGAGRAASRAGPRTIARLPAEGAALDERQRARLTELAVAQRLVEVGRVVAGGQRRERSVDRTPRPGPGCPRTRCPSHPGRRG
jgi:flavin-binding protein dodecin